MGKKMIGIAVAAIMLFGIFGLMGCENISLADYKETKSQALQDYANDKGESNYSTDEWEVIEKAITDGKTAIKNATTIPAVTTAFNDAKYAIDAVASEEVKEEKMNMEWVLSQFDLSDPKIFWDGTIDCEFEIDRVVIIMKKTSTYPKLELSHFKLDNGESLEYDFFKPSAEHLENFRQIAVITLKQHGKQKVMDAIRVLEELEFVRAALPRCIYDSQDD